MSFVEDNKAWILPLLGVGAVAVIWLNVRTLNQEPAPAQEPLPPVQTDPEPHFQTAQVTDPATAAGEALWDDLRPVAFVPPDLEARGRFDQKALLSLPVEAFEAPKAAAVIRPTGPEPAQPPRKSQGPGGSTYATAPLPDFLIMGPGGSQAWFAGRGYRPGQPLQGHPFIVRGIQILPTPKVTLQGATASTVRGTRSTPVQEVP